MVDELAPDRGYGHEVRVRQVLVPVHGERDLTRAGQGLVAATAWQAHTVTVFCGQKPQVSRVGLAPRWTLHVVAVAGEGAVLARLAREVHLQRAVVAQRGVPHVHCRQTVAHLVTGKFEPGTKCRSQLAV
jgi:hypothetical protein